MEKPDWTKDDLTIGELYRPAMEITEQAEADLYLARLIEHRARVSALSYAEAEQIERSNLGYFAGYFDLDTMQRVERLFGGIHPVFGSVQGKTLDEVMRGARGTI